MCVEKIEREDWLGILSLDRLSSPSNPREREEAGGLSGQASGWVSNHCLEVLRSGLPSLAPDLGFVCLSFKIVLSYASHCQPA